MEDVKQLLRVVDKLSADDRRFADSLIRQFNQRGSLSDKQMFWVRKLADRVERPEQHTCCEKKTANVGDFAGVYALFAKAMQHLKYPKIRLQTNDRKPVVLNVAGAKSRYAGQVNVTDGGSWGDNTWYGRIDQEGEWTVSNAADNDVADVLRRLADDPAAVASEYGRLTGHCCFCNTELSDERSTEVGYGPICAKHYGLPWGNK